jgi:hypothetical protein
MSSLDTDVEYYFKQNKKNGNLLNKHSRGILSVRRLNILTLRFPL